jgi:CheY-like chemotaxis protein
MAEGIGIALEWQPAAIVTDMHLADGTALGLMHGLKAAWPGSRPLPRLVVLTGDARSSLAARLRQAGASAVFDKPASTRDLLLATGLSDAGPGTDRIELREWTAMRRLLLRELRRGMSALDRAMEMGQLSQARAILHQLIASSAICGATALEGELRSLDDACRLDASPERLALTYWAVIETARRLVNGAQAA